MRRGALAVLGLVAVGVVALASPASAHGANQKASDAEPHRVGHYATIDVVNHASAMFQIPRAVSAWHAGFRLHACETTRPCVVVKSANYGPTTWMGLTYRIVWSDGLHYPTRIYLNSYPGFRTGGPNVTYQDAKHEMGHALGINHDYSGGVMYPVADGRHLSVSKYERRELHRIYVVR